jgi:hypothetical protein
MGFAYPLPATWDVIMTAMLCIVSRDRRDLFQELSEQFRGVSDVEVIFDRRIGQRRRVDVSTPVNRRRGERRQFRDDLRLLGWILTPRNRAGAMPLAG